MSEFESWLRTVKARDEGETTAKRQERLRKLHERYPTATVGELLTMESRG